MSTDSGRTPPATPMVSMPSSRLRKSGGTASPPTIIAAAVFATLTVQEKGATPTAAEETPGDGEVPVHISDIPEGQFVEDTPVGETPYCWH